MPYFCVKNSKVFFHQQIRICIKINWVFWDGDCELQMEEMFSAVAVTLAFDFFLCLRVSQSVLTFLVESSPLIRLIRQTTARVKSLYIRRPQKFALLVCCGLQGARFLFRSHSDAIHSMALGVVVDKCQLSRLLIFKIIFFISVSCLLSYKFEVRYRVCKAAYNNWWG